MQTRKLVINFITLGLLTLTGCNSASGSSTDKEDFESLALENKESTQPQNIEFSDQLICEALNFTTESGEVIPVESSTEWRRAYSDEQYMRFITDYPEAPDENKIQLKFELLNIDSKRIFTEEILKLSESYLLIENEDIREIFRDFNSLEVGNFEILSEEAAIFFDSKIQRRIDAVYNYCNSENVGK